MNIIDYPVFVLENEDDTSTIIIPHNAVGSWNSAYNLEQRNKADNTRKFCKWLRSTFKDTPSEFRYMSKKRVRDTRYRGYYHHRYKTINADKCFVAYNLSRNDMMRIKLSWQFTSSKAELSGKDSYDMNVWQLDQTERLEPSDDLKARLEKKTESKK